MLKLIIALGFAVAIFIIYKVVTGGNNDIEAPMNTGNGGGASADPNTPGNKGQDQSLEQPS